MLRSAFTLLPLLLLLPAGCSRKVPAVEVKILPPTQSQSASITHCDDPAKFSDLVAVLRSATAATDHKCAEIGVITLIDDRNHRDEYEILPGHDPARYEFRHNRKLYSVDRPSFLAAMQKLGVSSLPIGENQ